MKKVCFLLIIFLSFLLQTRISIFGVSPALTIVVVYYFGLKNGETKGILFGSFIGAIEDSLSGNILGPNLLAKGLVGFFASFMSGTVFRWTPVLGMIGLAFLTMFDGIIVFSSRAAFESMPASVSSACFTITISGILNVFFGIFLRPKDE